MLDPISAAIIGGSTMGAAAIGGSGGGGGGGAVSNLTPGQRELLELMTGTLGQQWGQGLTPYPGPRVAPIPGYMQQGFNTMGNMMGLAQPAINITGQALGNFDFGQGQQAAGLGMDALQRIMTDFDPTRAQEAWTSSMVNPALDVFKNRIAPFITEKLPQLGAKASGGVDREMARSGRQLAENLGGSLQNLIYQGEQAHMGRQLQAIPEAYRMGMMPTDRLNAVLGGVGGYPMNIMSNVMGTGGIERGITQEGLGADQQKWLEGQPYANPWLQYLGTALGTQAVSPYYQQGGPGMGALAMPMLGNMLGSEGFWNWANPAGASVASPWSQGMNQMGNAWLMGL